MNLDAGKLVAIMIETADCECCEAGHNCISCREYVEEFVRELVHRIDMEPLDLRSFAVPLVPGNVGCSSEDDGGLTVQCVISTSHVAYHSWPLQNRFRLVVDSCKNFNVSTLLRIIGEFFPVKRISIEVAPYKPPKAPGNVIDGQAEEQAEAEA